MECIYGRLCRRAGGHEHRPRAVARDSRRSQVVRARRHCRDSLRDAFRSRSALSAADAGPATRAGAGAAAARPQEAAAALNGKTARAVVLVVLAGLYLAGAMAHATRVNMFKARGDQSGYLWDAENVYANWHGKTPPVLIGERNRMPLYAGFLALFYRPTMSD